MPGQHARLSPSSAERWLDCPASVLAIEALAPEEEDSAYAHEGTMAHELGELEVSLHFGLIDDKTYLARHKAWKKACKDSGFTQEQLQDMEHYIEGYLELVIERAARYPDSMVLVEQRMDSGVPTCWGTSDTVIVSPIHVEIIDLKYGKGVEVEAVGNPQLRLYGLGALDTFGELLGVVEEVFITVYQPRIDNLSTELLSADELRAWREQIIPIAESALDGTGGFGPSEKACQWCPLSGQCEAQARAVFAVEKEDPAVMTEEQIATALEAAPFVKQWLADLEKVALTRAYEEHKDIPGFKVAMSGGVRKITDEEQAIEQLKALGLDPDALVVSKIAGLGALESLLKALPKVTPTEGGRARFQTLEDVIPGLLTRTEGKPSLVPASDRRPSITSLSEAQRIFG